MTSWLAMAGALAAQGCGRLGFDSVGATDDGAGAGAAAGATGAGGFAPGPLDAGAGGSSGGGARSSGGVGSGGSAATAAGGASAGGTGAGSAGGAPGSAGGAAGNAGGATPTDAGDASTGGSAGCVGCAAPAAIKLSGSTAGPLIGGTGGNLYTDVCPEDEVVIGYAGLTDVDVPPAFTQSLSTLCGKPALTGTGPFQTTITRATTLPRRGVLGTVAWEATCPADQVMVGFESTAAGFFGELSVLCAPLSVSAGGTPRAYTILRGATTRLPPVGGTAGTAMPTMLCPPGQVVRGNPLRAGQLVDAFSTICATPSLAYAQGASCTTAADCADGICPAGTCEPFTCLPSSACSCAAFEDEEYAFCVTQRTHADALSACVSAGMRLVRIDSHAENGWVRSTATLRGIGVLQTGGDSLAVANQWRWPDGTLFWQGTQTGSAPGGLYQHWRPYHPDTSPACAYMDRDAWWASVDCSTGIERYVCKNY